jgi:RNA polymerase sigma-70 factor (ECF subfamily)
MLRVLNSLPVVLVSVKSDKELIEKAIAGDSVACSLLFSRHRNNLYRFLRQKLRNKDVAEEITQETLLVAYKKLNTFRGDSSFYTWLCTIGLRKAFRKPKNSLKTDKELVSTVTPESLLESKQEVEQVLEAMVRLPPTQQKALFLKEYESMRYNEIADHLQCSPLYATKLVHEAKKAIRKELNDERRKLSNDECPA